MQTGTTCGWCVVGVDRYCTHVVWFIAIVDANGYCMYGMCLTATVSVNKCCKSMQTLGTRRHLVQFVTTRDSSATEQHILETAFTTWPMLNFDEEQWQDCMPITHLWLKDRQAYITNLRIHLVCAAPQLLFRLFAKLERQAVIQLPLRLILSLD